MSEQNYNYQVVISFIMNVFDRGDSSSIYTYVYKIYPL